MNITGSRDGKIFFIDDDKVMIDGKMYYEKVPQNLPKADEYSLLADVRAAIIKISVCNKEYGRTYLDLSEVLEVIDAKISEHFS